MPAGVRRPAPGRRSPSLRRRPTYAHLARRSSPRKAGSLRLQPKSLSLTKRSRPMQAPQLRRHLCDRRRMRPMSPTLRRQSKPSLPCSGRSRCWCRPRRRSPGAQMARMSRSCKWPPRRFALRSPPSPRRRSSAVSGPRYLASSCGAARTQRTRRSPSQCRASCQTCTTPSPQTWSQPLAMKLRRTPSSRPFSPSRPRSCRPWRPTRRRRRVKRRRQRSGSRTPSRCTTTPQPRRRRTSPCSTRPGHLARPSMRSGAPEVAFERRRSPASQRRSRS
mmetsp:Transcript_127134/g.368063  ORF Transcript_127134/g.368063 Transcript_127134/m.368063 type:complete len:276 (-) Transcript_127134:1290-2117(-)